MPKGGLRRITECHPERVHEAHGLCKSCYEKSHFEGNMKRKQDKIRSARASQLRLKYEITTTQWNKMYERQKGICPICLHKLHKYGNKEGYRAAAVDHDHRTKRVRGLVCWQCNRHRISNNTAERAKRIYEHLVSEFDGRKL